MKSLSALKRRLTIGTLIDTEHLQTGWKPGPRIVAQVNTKSFGLLTPEKENRISWCDWPKASELEILDDNTFIIHSLWFKNGIEQLVPLLKYTIIPPPLVDAPKNPTI